MSSDRDPAKGDEYKHPDGTVEVVFAKNDGCVVVFKEYKTVEQFDAAVEDAAYQGVNEEVAALPPAETFVEPGEEF